VPWDKGTAISVFPLPSLAWHWRTVVGEVLPAHLSSLPGVATRGPRIFFFAIDLGNGHMAESGATFVSRPEGSFGR